VILGEAAIERRFAAGRRVSEILRSLAVEAGAEPIADYAWEVHPDGTAAGARTSGVARHLRRVTSVGLISLREESPGEGGATWFVRAQMVTLQQCADIAIVRKERSAGDGFWELHVGDGNPRPVPEPDLPAAFALVRAALEATRR
jgi:hypothetical protein